jgi:hypothetical protein
LGSRRTFDAAVAGAISLLGRDIDNYGLLLIHESAGHSLLGLRLRWWLQLMFGTDALSGTIDNATVLHESLHHPVTRARTVNARIHACRAEIIVSVVADAAVEMLVLHSLAAVVTKDDPRALWALLRSEG